MDGHDVEYVAETKRAITDDEVLSRANEGERVLMTSDKDFGELVFRLRRVTSGVVLLRLAGLPAAMKSDSVSKAVLEHGAQMAGAFSVISRGMVRIRPRI